MMDDPCFKCTLPDCDETSPKCDLRKLYQAADRKSKRKSRPELTPLEHEGRRAFYSIWRLEHEAKISEARPAFLFKSGDADAPPVFDGFFE